MLSQWELWAVANKILEQHGEDARDFIAERRRQLQACGDAAGVDAWARIVACVEQLEAEPAGPLQ
jgi:hypothetical protein